MRPRGGRRRLSGGGSPGAAVSARPGPRTAGKTAASPLARALSQAALCLVAGARHPLPPPILWLLRWLTDPAGVCWWLGWGEAKCGISPFSAAFHGLASPFLTEGGGGGTTGSDRAVGLAGELVFPLFSVSLPLPVEEGEGGGIRVVCGVGRGTCFPHPPP